MAIFTRVWVSRYETYRFPRVDGLSTNTPDLGRHIEVSDESYTHLEQAVFEISFSFCKFSVNLCSPYSTVGFH